MKRRNSLAILCSAAFIMSLAMVGCGKSKKPSGSQDSSEPAAQTFTVSFDSQGGSAVAAQQVEYGGKATRPENPTKEGYTFVDWFEDSIGVTLFDFNTTIKSDWTLYAKWTAGGSTSEDPTSEDPSSEDPSSSEQSTHGHGPEGSHLVEWYLCGSGSLWGESGWTTAGGVQLFSNPAGESDKGCILSIPFQVGDAFKVTDGSTWFGYEKVTTSGENCAGGTHFAGDDDGFGGQNIKCTVAGTFDMYINGEGQFWIQLSN